MFVARPVDKVAYGADMSSVSKAVESIDIDNAELATTMLTRGSVGVLLGAACAPKGKEAVWAAGGFVVGTLLGQPGIIAIALAGLWKKADG